MPTIPPSANSRVVASREPVASPSASVETDSKLALSEVAVRLQRPKTRHTFGRRLLNTITFGWYTKNKYNPAQWAAFRDALLVRYSALGAEKVDDVLRTYEHTRRLSQSKASLVLETLDRQRASNAVGQAVVNRDDLSPLTADARPLNADQSARHRAARTRLEVARDLTARESAASDRLKGLQERFEHTRPDQSAMGSARLSEGGDDFGLIRREGGPSAEEAARLELAKDLQSAAMILKPGRSIGFNAVDLGQRSIKTMALRAGVRFDYHNMASREMPVTGHLDEVIQEKISAFKSSGSPQVGRSLYAVPLLMQDNSRFFREDHSVLVMIDFDRKKLLYLDAKGFSPRNAERKYANTEGLQQGLEQLGKSAFGYDWDFAEGLLMLSNAKQQGANDCGAFTHDFTRRLVVDGVGIADIERDFDAGNRGLMRVRMLENILDQGLLEPPAVPVAPNQHASSPTSPDEQALISDADLLGGMMAETKPLTDEQARRWLEDKIASIEKEINDNGRSVVWQEALEKVKAMTLDDVREAYEISERERIRGVMGPSPKRD